MHEGGQEVVIRSVAVPKLLCSHCALCHAELVLHISTIINFSQAGMALILAVALGYFGSLKEEKLIKMGLLTKLAGFFCKKLPTLENLADVASLALFSWLVIITYVPPIFDLEWMEDCFSNELLRVTCFIPLLLWLCRFLLGRCAKRYTRVPPQLYTPVRRLPVGLRHLNAFMRCLGPV
ncbi:PIP5K4 [Symbiodinium natans]|uniref:PIP5K4 protein n=1 Tax=Symbiodinium natans TaxID=878477 RepID=A0A812TKS9_9DINO|nr:PIP5K4 [Symbiodinium natans]